MYIYIYISNHPEQDVLVFDEETTPEVEEVPTSNLQLGQYPSASSKLMFSCILLGNDH